MIRRIHKDSDGTCGMPRVHAERVEGRCRVGRKRIARLMRESGLVGVSPHRGTRSTRVDRNHRAAADRVQRQFRAEAPDRNEVADVTYVPTWNGFVSLAIVLDVFSRKGVGMANHLRTELGLEALNMALAQRRPQRAIPYSDKGAQYTSPAFGKRCRDRGIVTSTGAAGDCYDNTRAERFFATLECELIKRRSLQTQAEALMAIFEFIEGWYNTKRRHSGLGDLSPNEFERRTAATAKQAQGDARERDRNGLEPCQSGRPGTHTPPLGRPPTPVSDKDPLPSAIVHLSAGDDSPQPSTETG